MIKKKSILIVIVMSFILITIGIIVLILNSTKKTVETYSKITIDKYQFTINDKYKYQYLNDKNYGILNNEIFLSSYIFIEKENYSSMINSTSYYTNMGAKELDSSVEEMKFGEYEGFVNVKKVHYDDINKDYNLVIILIKIEDARTLVFQYEVSIDEDVKILLSDIKKGLSEIKKIN